MTSQDVSTAKRRALVTGASSGIGEQFAYLLAAKGYDLVLVARSGDRLAAIAEELRERFGTASEVIVADLTSDDEVQSTAERVGRAPFLDVVINNAGSGWHGSFAEQTAAEITTIIDLNIRALALISAAAMKMMTERRWGWLLNVSSTASFVPGPTVALYHASKAFVTSLSESLHEEALPLGIHVSALCPGITPTNFQSTAGTEHSHTPRLMITSASRVAAEGFAALERNDAICVPGGVYKAISVLAHLAPRGLVRFVARQVVTRL